MNERLDVQNLLFEHCVIKVYCSTSLMQTGAELFRGKRSLKIDRSVKMP